MLKEAISKQPQAYKLPHSEEILSLKGSPEFIQKMQEMLDIMVYSPTALKILNFNAQHTQSVIEEWQNPLDLGRNTGKTIQLAKVFQGQDCQYKWLTLLPHEIRHAYNAPKTGSQILDALAYAIINEADAQAIEGLIALEIKEYMEQHHFYKENPFLKNFFPDKKYSVFYEAYQKSSGTPTERKVQAMESFVRQFSRLKLKEYHGYKNKTFAEVAYRTALERNVSLNGGWNQFESEENFQKKEQEFFQTEKETICKKWPTFCLSVMKGTLHTDVIPYGQKIKPENFIKTFSPELHQHFVDLGVISK